MDFSAAVGTLASSPTGITLSKTQARAWFLEVFGTTPGDQQRWATYRVQGQVDVRALFWCLRAQVVSHDLLKLNVHSKQGQPVAQLRETAAKSLVCLDLSGLPEPDRLPAAMQLLHEARHTALPLTHQCWRFLLIKLSPRNYFLQLTLHHMVADEYSLFLLLSELGSLYRQRVEAGPMLLGEEAITYQELAISQEKLLGEKPLPVWWAKQLGLPARTLGQLPARALLFGVKATPGCHNQAGVIHFRLPMPLLSQAARLAQSSEVTLETLCLTSYLIFLRGRSGHDQLLVALHRSAREQLETAGIVGPLEKLVPVRSRFSGTDSFNNCLNQIHQYLQGAMSAGIWPFAQLLEALNIRRHMDGEALVQLGFGLYEPLQAFFLGSAIAEAVPCDSRRMRLDLDLRLSPETAQATLAFNQGLYNQDQALQLSTEWLKLLEDLIQAPDVALEQLAPALAAPQPPAPEPKLQPVAPRDWIEMELWQLLSVKFKLGINSIYSSVFEASGMDSFLALRLLSSLRKTYALFLSTEAFFKEPTIAAVAQQIRQDLYDKYEAPALDGLSATMPLCHRQRRLWYQQYLKGGGATWHHSLVLRLQGKLQEKQLERAFFHLLQRHPCLQTAVTSTEALPLVFQVSRNHPLPLHNLSHLSEAEAAWRAEEIIADKMCKSFTQPGTPLLRTALIRLSAQNHLLLLVVHRLICDSWSLGVLRRELTIIYRAFINKQASPLPPPAFHFHDYASWQLGPAIPLFREQLAYWTSQLAGCPQLHSLATDQPRPAIPDHEGDQLEFKVEGRLFTRLHQLALQEGTGLNVILHAAFAVLLCRYSGVREVVVGAVIRNRIHAQLEHMVGPISSLVALRHDLGDNPSFAHFLRCTRAIFLQANEFGQVPFEDVIEALHLQRNTSYEPLCQIICTINPQLLPAPSLVELQISPEPPPRLAIRHDLNLVITISPERLDGAIAYASELFEENTIAQMVGHFTRLLGAVVHNPLERVSELNFYSDEELRQLLESWNHESATQTGDTLYAHFERTALRLDKLAINSKNRQVSYAQLHALVQQLAGRLGQQGVGCGQAVAVCAPAGVDQAVALLAILAVGGMAVPVLPSFAPALRERLLRCSGARLLLSVPGGWTSAQALNLSIPSTAMTGLPSWQPPVVFHNSPALLSFRSRGTGLPTGIILSQRALWRAMAAQLEAMQLMPGQKLALVETCWRHPLTSCLIPLCAGAQLHLLEDQLPSPVARSFDHLMCSSSRARDCQGFTKTLWLDAAFVDATLAMSLATSEVTLKLWHSSAETGWWATRDQNKAFTDMDMHQQLVGSLVGESRVYLMDAFGAPTPLGGVGELFLGKNPLATGYLGQPALTALHFVPDAFGLEHGQRLFRSGFKGRCVGNHQLALETMLVARRQLQDQWFYPSDVEILLTAHKDVAAVRVGPAVPPAERATVWLDSADGLINAAGLQAYLQCQLPDMPHLDFVVVPGLGQAGSTDVARLTDTSARNRQGYQPAGTRAEAQLSKIFAEVLCLETVGIHDDLFLLGAHSFHVVQVINLIRQRLKRRIPPSTLFEHSSVKELAACIAGFGAPTPSHPAIESPPEERLSLSPAQQLRFQHLAGQQLTAVLRLFGPVLAAPLEAAMFAMHRSLPSLQARFVTQGTATHMILDAPTPPLQVVDLDGLALNDVEPHLDQLLKDICQPFALATGPCWRMALVRKDPWETLLVIRLHPFVWNKPTLDLFWQHLARAYGACRTGIEPLCTGGFPQDAPTMGVLEREAQVQQQLRYWCTQLAGAEPGHQLPSDHARPAKLSGVGKRQTFQIAAAQVRELQQLSLWQGSTLFVGLQVIYAALLARYASTGELCVAIPSYRQGQGTNAVIVRHLLAEHMSFLEHLMGAHQLTQDALAHGEVTYEEVVLALSQRQQRCPALQLTFALHTQAQTPAFPDLEVVPQQLPCQTTPVEIGLTFQHDQGALCAVLEYSPDLFDEQTMIRLAQHYQTLLGEILNQPGKALSQLELINEYERELILMEWSGQSKPDRGNLICYLLKGLETWPEPPPVWLAREHELEPQGVFAAKTARMYVLDPLLRPVPVGVTGEICLGGACIFQGNLNRRSASAQLLVADPYALEPGGRLYRTGVLGRWFMDGTLGLAGRLDERGSVSACAVKR